MRGHSKRAPPLGKKGGPCFSGNGYQFLHCTVAYHSSGERSVNVSGGTTVMNADRKSDESVVPITLVNKGSTELPAELGEGSDSTKRNVERSALPRHFIKETGKAGPSVSHVDCTACTIKLTLGCPQGQHAQIHRFVASRQRRLSNRSLFQLEEDGGNRSRWGHMA